MRQIWRDPSRLVAASVAAIAFGACGWIAGGAPFGVGMGSIVLLTLLAQDSDDLQNRGGRRRRKQ